MSDKNLLGFPNKKERDDFLIAFTVILFFAWIMTRFVGCGKDLPQIPDVKDVVAEVPVLIENDSDKDGIIDTKDACPMLAGIVENNGCPSDKDGDGIYDKDDKCPNKAGIAKNKGCPPFVDSDEDGIADENDNCPNIAGVEANAGCPADRDGDGIYDKDDKCPGRKGTLENKGCPEIKVDEADAEVLRTAIQAVEFETGNAYLKRNSMKILRKIVDILNKYPRYKIDIIGHTDNQGKEESNMTLSQARAKACMDYLIENGIAANRIAASGKGESQPISTNDTELGRSENRRVEFKLKY